MQTHLISRYKWGLELPVSTRRHTFLSYLPHYTCFCDVLNLVWVNSSFLGVEYLPRINHILFGYKFESWSNDSLDFWPLQSIKTFNQSEACFTVFIQKFSLNHHSKLYSLSEQFSFKQIRHISKLSLSSKKQQKKSHFGFLFFFSRIDPQVQCYRMSCHKEKSNCRDQSHLCVL